MLEEILKETESKMRDHLEFFNREMSTLRAGRATPALLERIRVDYYGTPTPLNQMAGISVPEPRLLVIQPWDKSVLGEVEKALLKSDLGITPNNDGNVIRLAIPQLTEERRTELVRAIRKKAEEMRVAMRNSRREANDQIKEWLKDGGVSEDQARRAQDRVQELTDSYIARIDEVLATKEEEIMSV